MYTNILLKFSIFGFTTDNNGNPVPYRRESVKAEKFEENQGLKIIFVRVRRLLVIFCVFILVSFYLPPLSCVTVLCTCTVINFIIQSIDFY